MINFKNWLAAFESSASTRRATGPYPPQPNDFFIRPPYGKEKTCDKIGEFKPINLDTVKICGGKDENKPKNKTPKKVN